MPPRVSRHSISGEVPPASERVTILVQRIHNKGRFLRGAGRTALWLVGATVFVGSVVGAALLHLDLAPTRRVAQAIVNAALATPFRGRIEIGEIQHLEATGARVADARLVDADGRVVIEAWGIEGRFATWGLLRSLADGQVPLAILVPEADVERAHVRLIDDGENIPTIAWAFDERVPTPPDPTSRDVDVRLPDVRVARVDVDGDLGVPIDASLGALQGRVRVTDSMVVVDVEDTPVELRSLVPGGVAGAASYHLRAWIDDGPPPEGRPTIGMWADFSGEASGLGAIARWQMADDRVRMQIDLPKITPRELHALVPDAPLEVPAHATVTAEGTFARLELDGRLEIETSDGAGTASVVAVEGVLGLEDEVTLDARFDARGVDLAALVPAAPVTRIDGRGRVALHLADDGPRMVVDAATDPTAIAGQPVPAIDAHLALAGDEVRIAAHADEPGASADVAVRVLPGGSLVFGGEADAPALAAVPRLGGAVGGAARAEARGTMTDGILDARWSIDARGVTAGDVHLGTATARGRLGGPPPDFAIAAEVTATDVVVGADGGERTALATARLRVDGPVLAPRLSLEGEDATGGAITARAQANLPARALTGVAFSIDREGDRVEGRADRLAIVPGGVDVRGVQLAGDGVGSLRGGLRVTGGELSGDLRGENLDLARVARLFGFRAPIAGLVNLDVAVTPTRQGRRGHLDLEVERGELAVVHGVSARLSARFTGEQVEASGYLRLVDEATAEERAGVAGSGPDAPALCDGAIAEVRLAHLDAVVSGPLLEAATWTRATGTADVSAERWNLHCLARRFPFVLPVSDARGTLTTRIRARRDEDDRVPTLESVYVRTRDLELVGAKPLIGEPSWATRDIDLELEGSFDGGTGVAPFSMTLFDETYLATASGEIDLDGVIDARAGGVADAVELVPIDLAVEVPRRGFDELGTLPSPLREAIPAMLGDFRMRAWARGPIGSPSLGAELTVFDVQPPGAAADWTPPIDGQATLIYEAATGEAVLSATAQLENATVAQVVAGAEVPWPALRAGTTPLPWRAGVTATLNELPVGSFPLLADRGIQGSINGQATLTGLNERPSLDVELELPFVQLGDAYFDGVVRASIDPAAPADASLGQGGAIDAAASAPDIADATLEIELRDQQQGSLELLGHARVAWVDGLIPTIDQRRRGGISMSADHLRLAAVEPAVVGILSKVDGLLDGNLVFEWGDAAGAGKITSAELTLSDGMVYVPAIGQELRAVSARISSDGPGDFIVEDVVAEGLSGRVTASGRVVVDGLTVDRAAAVVVIDEDEQLPLTVEGVPLGRAWGRIEVDLHNQPEANAVAMNVAVPDFHLAMPSTGARSLQALEDHPDVVVGVPLGPPEEEGRAAEATDWEIAVEIDRLRVEVGDLALIQVRTGGSLPGGGQPRPVVVSIAEDLSTQGDLVVTEGTFDFLGKEFVLDGGIVRLVPAEPENPFVNVTAHWEGPDGGRIFLDYVGVLMPITDEKIRLRSDPPRTEREILATLIFGDSLSDIPEGGSSTGGDRDGNLANTVGASVASSGLNSILKNTALSRFSAELGTTDRGNFRSGIELEVDSWTFGAANERIDQGVERTTSGGVQQRQAQTLNELSAEWRFWRNWSLRGTAGRRESQTNANTLLGIDVLWQYRY